MNEDYNPYDKRRTEEPYDGYSQPEDHRQQAQYPPEQDYYRQPNQYRQPYRYDRQNYYYPEQNTTNSRRSGGTAAKVLSIISFAVGCASLLRILSLVFGLSMKGVLFKTVALSGSDMLSVLGSAVPGLVIGIIALVKKTKLFPMALLGVIFGGAAVAAVFSFYFLKLSFG